MAKIAKRRRSSVHKKSNRYRVAPFLGGVAAGALAGGLLGYVAGAPEHEKRKEEAEEAAAEADTERKILTDIAEENEELVESQTKLAAAELTIRNLQQQLGLEETK